MAPWLQRVPFKAPSWTSKLRKAPPKTRVLLANLPTPLIPWSCPLLQDLSVRWSLKRDDLCGLELSGNKTRKLEFLLAEALDKGHDCVVTIGGLQSNHCRATAVAARMVNLEAHLVLLVKDQMMAQDPGLEGNLLLSRLAGATLHLCAASTYRSVGGDLRAADLLNEEMAQQLRRQGKNPYVIPVGGTCPTGTWGYLSAVEELQEQLSPEDPVDHIVVAAGSGGTLAGLALALHLTEAKQQLHGVNIQHEPEVYRQLIASEALGLGCDEALASAAARRVQLLSGSGLGYAQSSQAELQCLADVAKVSGVILDHVYAGKALYHFCEYAKANPDAFRNSHILFWHTGGFFGLYSQAERLQSLSKRVSTFVPTTLTS